VRRFPLVDEGGHSSRPPPPVGGDAPPDRASHSQQIAATFSMPPRLVQDFFYTGSMIPAHARRSGGGNVVSFLAYLVQYHRPLRHSSLTGEYFPKLPSPRRPRYG
jgi:hypothetical protein